VSGARGEPGGRAASLVPGIDVRAGVDPLTDDIGLAVGRGGTQRVVALAVAGMEIVRFRLD
jgi:hypothetical protein